MTMKSERPVAGVKLVCRKCIYLLHTCAGLLRPASQIEKKKYPRMKVFEGQVSRRVQRGARGTYQEKKIKIIGCGGRLSGFRWYNENYQPVRPVMVKISYGASRERILRCEKDMVPTKACRLNTVPIGRA